MTELVKLDFAFLGDSSYDLSAEIQLSGMEERNGRLVSC